MRIADLQSNPATEATIRHDLNRLRKVTGEIVGSVFFGTLLKTMRQSNLKGAYGHGGRGEEIFAAQLHGVLAERAGKASSNNWHDHLFRRLETQQRRFTTSRLNHDSGAGA